MKILAGIPWNLDSHLSGFSKRTRNCLASVAELGIEHEVYCLGPTENRGDLSLKELEVNKTVSGDEFSPLLNSVAFSHEFAKKVDQSEYDILHCYNTSSLFLTHRKHIFETTNPTYAYALEQIKGEVPDNSKYNRLLKYYEAVSEVDKIEYENADLVISKSETVTRNIINHYDIDEELIQVIPNGVREEEINYPGDKVFDNKLKIVLFPGTVHIMKGFHYLLEAMKIVRKELPNVMLMVCGRLHPYESDIFSPLIQEKRKESGVVLAGHLPREKL